MKSIRATIIDIHNRQQHAAEIHWHEQRIIAINKINTNEKLPYAMPGFCDAHIHIESSMLLPQAFAAEVVKHGTIATVSDPHEIANVCGKDGVYYMIQNAQSSPLYINFGAPSCVPATLFETAGAVLNAEDVKELLQRSDIRYLSEMMNYPGVLNNDEEVMKKIHYAHELNKPVDGHAPGLTGNDAFRYIRAGISTDHECFTYEEALFKVQNDMKILIREGSSAKNFEALYPLIDDYPDRVMLCTDDSHPDDLLKGHINLIVKRALDKGCNLYHVLRAASLNVRLHYGLEYGLLRVGDYADFILADDLNTMHVNATYIKGECVASAGKSYITVTPAEPINQFGIDTIRPEELAVQKTGTKVRVIHALDGQLITKESLEYLPVDTDNNLQSDITQDIVKIAVVNRYTQQKPAIAFIKNTGLKQGAFASSVAHDSHNIVAVGTNDDDLCDAINAVINHRGGLSVACNKEIQTLALPVAGLMSLMDAQAVGHAYEALDKKVKEYGSVLRAPFMTLSFMALLVIPQLKLSDKGLFDGSAFRFVPLQEA
jgi:adenine deaminase